MLKRLELYLALLSSFLKQQLLLLQSRSLLTFLLQYACSMLSFHFQLCFEVFQRLNVVDLLVPRQVSVHPCGPFYVLLYARYFLIVQIHVVLQIALQYLFYLHDQYGQYGEHMILDLVEYRSYIRVLRLKYQDHVQQRLLQQELQ